MAVTISQSISQNSQSISGNYSNVTVTVTARWTYGSWNANKCSGSCTINGSAYSFSHSFNTGQSSSGSQVIFSKNVNIVHNTDGTKALYCSAWFATDVSSGTVRTSASRTLSTIPRSSNPTLSASSVIMGNNLTIYTNRASSGFTHTITYACGSASGTIATGVGASVVWAVPTSLITQSTKANSISCTITCKTYSGSTLIGTKAVVVSLVVPANIVPTLDSTAISDAVNFKDTYGKFIQNKSQPKFVITASGIKGSTMVSATVACNSVKITEKFISGIATITLPTIVEFGTLTATVTVNDSRGRTATAKYSLVVTEYSAPSINNMAIIRCDVAGNDDNEGEYVKITLNAAIAPIENQNENKIIFKKKPTTTGTWTAIETIHTYAYDSYVIASADPDNTLDIMVELTDDFTAIQRSMALPVAYTLMDFRASGTGISFGKVSEYDNLFECDLPAQFNNSLTIAGLPVVDYPVETGVVNGWKIKKMANGDAECWACFIGYFVNEGSQFSWYYKLPFFTLPEGLFLRVDNAQASGSWGTGISRANIRNVNTNSVQITFESNQDDGNYQLWVDVKGRWKE